jgi:hypothetical protein
MYLHFLKALQSLSLCAEMWRCSSRSSLKFRWNLRPQSSGSKSKARKQQGVKLKLRCTLVTCTACLTLKIEEVHSSIKSVNFYQAIRRCIPEVVTAVRTSDLTYLPIFYLRVGLSVVLPFRSSDQKINFHSAI